MQTVVKNCFFFHLIHDIMLQPVTCYMSSLCLVAHTAFTKVLQATFLGLLLFFLFPPMSSTLPLSLSTVHLHVVLGLPLLLFPCGAQLIAILQSLHAVTHHCITYQVISAGFFKCFVFKKAARPHLFPIKFQAFKDSTLCV